MTDSRQESPRGSWPCFEIQTELTKGVAGIARVVNVDEERRAPRHFPESIGTGCLPPRPCLVALLVPPAGGHDDGAHERKHRDGMKNSLDVPSKEARRTHLDPYVIRRRRRNERFANVASKISGRRESLRQGAVSYQCMDSRRPPVLNASRVSIVIPTRNDAEALARTVSHLGHVTGLGESEVIVAAAGNREATQRAVAGWVRLLWPGGSTRAELLNAGAAAAHGDVLFFLHADSFPPSTALTLIEEALSDPRVVGGAFEHLFDEPSVSLRLITYINRARYRLTRNYYGDQGLFVRTSVFRELGGYHDLRLLEDLDFAQRLKRCGRSILVRQPLRTSGRRFLERGPWRTFFFIVWLLALHTLGLDTQRYAERWRGPADRAPGMPWPRGVRL